MTSAMREPKTEYTLWDEYSVKDEQIIFRNILYHDAKGGRAAMFLLNPYEENSATTIMRKNPNYLSNTRISNNVYMSLNVFTGANRRSSDVFAYTNIAVDIDCHEGDSADPHFIWEHLQKKFETGLLPYPTMVTYTGRGLGVFYTLERSIPAQTKGMSKKKKKAAKKALFLRELTYKALFSAYKKELETFGCVIDTCVSDCARVMRVPGTLNQRSGTVCSLLGVYKQNDAINYVSLRALANEVGVRILTPEEREAKKIERIKNATASDRTKYKMARGRLRKLEALIDLRNKNSETEGYRDNLLFVAHAFSCEGGMDSEKVVRHMNELFAKPFCERALMRRVRTFEKSEEHMKKRTDGKKSYYTFSNERLIELLAITEEEKKAIGLNNQSQLVMRAENRTAKKLRDEKILSLFEQGYLYDEIADAVNCTSRTVKNVLKKNDCARYNKAETTDGNHANEEVQDAKNTRSHIVVPESEKNVNTVVVNYQENKSAIANTSITSVCSRGISARSTTGRNKSVTNIARNNTVTEDIATKCIARNIVATDSVVTNATVSNKHINICSITKDIATENTSSRDIPSNVPSNNIINIRSTTENFSRDDTARNITVADNVVRDSFAAENTITNIVIVNSSREKPVTNTSTTEFSAQTELPADKTCDNQTARTSVAGCDIVRKDDCCEVDGNEYNCYEDTPCRESPIENDVTKMANSYDSYDPYV